MNKFHHLTQVRLGAGSTIESGNWGRLLHKYENATVTGQQFGNARFLARELVFELERERNFSDKPSRMNSTFSCLSREDAEEYQRLNDAPSAQVLHIVELVDPSLPRHFGCLSLTSWPPPNRSFLDVMSDQVKRYWQGQGEGLQEMLSPSALRVVVCIS